MKSGEYVIMEPINFDRLHDPEDPESPPVKDITFRLEAGAATTIIRMSDTTIDPDTPSVVIFDSKESGKAVVEKFTLTGGKGSRWGSAYGQSGWGGILVLGGPNPSHPFEECGYDKTIDGLTCNTFAPCD